MNTRTSCRNIQKTVQTEITDQDLHKKYSKLIYHVAWTMKRITAYHLTDEDVHDIAQAAFVRLIALPQEKRNYPAAYHRTVINNACRTELKKILEHNNRVCSYNEPANESGGTYESVFADPHEHTEEKVVAKMTVERCLQVLDALAMQIVILAVGLHGQTPHTPHKIARKLGLPKQDVEQTLENSFTLMRTVASTA